MPLAVTSIWPRKYFYEEQVQRMEPGFPAPNGRKAPKGPKGRAMEPRKVAMCGYPWHPWYMLKLVPCAKSAGLPLSRAPPFYRLRCLNYETIAFHDVLCGSWPVRTWIAITYARCLGPDSLTNGRQVAGKRYKVPATRYDWPPSEW